MACLLLAAGLAAQPALAFYPFGFFSPGGEGGTLIFVTWPFEVMDVNGDGDISGDADGVPVNFEVGPDGFDEDTAQRIFGAFEEWERTGTAFVAFSRGPDITDPVELASGFDQIDGFNVIAYQSPTDPVITNSAALSLYAFVVEPTTVVIDNFPVLFTEPQFIDVDVIYNPAIVDPLDQSALFVYEALSVLVGGGMLGLGNSPLENFVSDTPSPNGFLTEEEVITLRNFQGILEPRGVTSSMFNAPYVTDLGNGVLEFTAHDLAPDDIVGITFLYPRMTSDLFFDITGYARTQSTVQIPSRPIAGAWIRAYVNANNTTNRVPFVDTFTGLYTPPINPTERHRFELKGLFKQMETAGGITFEANYTLTCAEFRPLLDFDPAAGIDTRTSLDSTHGGFGSDATPANYTGFGFDALFLSEVFNESGNIVGQQNLSQGTPLAFDVVRREVVSTLSGLSLLQIVGPERIVFGDDGIGAAATTGCPFNQIITASVQVSGGGPNTPSALRALRDNVLLNSGVGVAATDLYYRVSPLLSRVVSENVYAMRALRGFTTVGDGLLRNPAIGLLVLCACALMAAAKRWRIERVARGAAILLLSGILLVSSAGATTSWSGLDTMSDYVDFAHYIVHGTVEVADSHWTPDGKRIVTDVTLRVEDSVKGRVNKGGLIHFRLPTGQVGAVVRMSPQLPGFVVGEEIVLFLRDRGETGLGIVGGKSGKFIVKETRSETKYVGVLAPPPNPHLRQAAAEIKALREGRSDESDAAESDESTDSAVTEEKAADDGPITLEEFKDYIRYLDRELRKGRR